MNRTKILLIAVLLGCLFFSISNAQPVYKQKQTFQSENNSNNSGHQSRAELPVKNQVLFLIVTGTIICLKYFIDAALKHKFQKSKILKIYRSKYSKTHEAQLV